MFRSSKVFLTSGIFISQTNHLNQALIIVALPFRQSHILFRIKITGFFFGCHVSPRNRKEHGAKGIGKEGLTLCSMRYALCAMLYAF